MTCKSKLFCGLQCPWLFPLCYHTLPRFPSERISWEFLNERHKWLKWTDEIQSRNERTAWWDHWWKYNCPLPIKVYSFPFPFWSCQVEFPEPGLMLRKMVCFFNLCLRRFLRTVVPLSMSGSPCSRAVLCPHKALGIGFGEPEGASSPSPASLPWVPGFSHTCVLFSAAPCCPCRLQGFEQCCLNARRIRSACRACQTVGSAGTVGEEMETDPVDLGFQFGGWKNSRKLSHSSVNIGNTVVLKNG